MISTNTAVLRQSALALKRHCYRSLSSSSICRSDISSPSTSTSTEGTPTSSASAETSKSSENNFCAPASFTIPSRVDPNNVKIVHYPFYIQRTHPGGNLPVYSVYKQNRCITLIRKIDGNPEILCTKLRETFTKVTHNKLTNQVSLEGNHVEDVKRLLAGYGF